VAGRLAPTPAVFWITAAPRHDTDSYNPAVQAHDHGYAVVMVNYRGSTGYGLLAHASWGNPA
jgi:dipeptidyl aminopeptidase/acylaminoacyl peptidase